MGQALLQVVGITAILGDPLLTIIKAAVLPTVRGLRVSGIRGGGLFAPHGGSQRLCCGLCVCVKVKEGV